MESAPRPAVRQRSKSQLPVYTRTLLPRLKSVGRITDIARDVRREVRELAASVAHVQTPAYYDEVVGDFCPAGCEAKAVAGGA